MPLAEEARNEQRIAEVTEMAISALVVDCGVSFATASKMLIAAAAQNLTPGAVADALRNHTPPTVRSLIG